MVVALIGVAVVAWAIFVAVLAQTVSLRPAVRLVMVANLAAATGIATFSIWAATPLVLWSLIAIAIDVAAFATSQLVSLLRLRAAALTPDGLL